MPPAAPRPSTSPSRPRATPRRQRKIVSIVNAYHGHTGLAVAAGADRFSKIFLSDQPDEFFHVPFNDLNAMEDALEGQGRRLRSSWRRSRRPTAFPMPLPGYLTDVKKLCERYDALYIADEVQTGLMRSGEMWGYQRYGIQPDIMVTGKGISGGMYPIACVVGARAACRLAEAGRLCAYVDHGRRRAGLPGRHEGAGDPASGRR